MPFPQLSSSPSSLSSSSSSINANRSILLRLAVERLREVSPGDVILEGLPGVSVVSINEELEIFSVDGTILAEPIPVAVTRISASEVKDDAEKKRQARRRRELRAQRREPQLINEAGTIWLLIEKPGQEAIAVDDNGRDILVPAEKRAVYKMTCACERVRYARPNAIHEVTLCRICYRRSRSEKRKKK